MADIAPDLVNIGEWTVITFVFGIGLIWFMRR